MVQVRRIGTDSSNEWLGLIGSPELFAERLETYWRDEQRAIFSLLFDAQQRTAANWRALGRALTDGLLADNSYVGLCFDGDPAFDDRVLGWLRTIRDHTNRARVEVGVIELKWILGPHAIKQSSNLNTTWTSLQATPDAGWLQSFWDDLDSKYFHYGCDLILTAYPARIWDENPWDEPLTISAFLATIERASAWLIPLDGERGFLVGALAGSPLHRRLSKGTL